MILISLMVILAGCGASNAADSDTIKVVAAENFWGSIAKQLGGDKVHTISIIDNPNTDPHDYDATASDGRNFAESQLAVVNGLGYDKWAQDLLDANPDSKRHVIDVGDIAGLKDGDNPHRWYSPDDVRGVIDAISANLQQLSPANSQYFQQQHDNFVNNSLAEYNQAISSIKASYAQTPVGATESIFQPLATDLGLNLITPEGFLNAISEGSDPTLADKKTADEQIANKQIKALVYNSQNATPDVQTLLDEAKDKNIPVVSVTETMVPASSTFQAWQTGQLLALKSALEKAAQ